ncbi:DUF7737 domain-containing protein [Nonomuraea sp. KM90]|uniref:DUF7737 domain-containing protein n=1 Tax=Nonomuraea sp. KM90 TaxID=3457428 RepID=UPI003FCC4814
METAEVPPLVFSEAMRDVDLFVAVTSIAADPQWQDRGEDEHRDYWRETSVGPLPPSAEVRRDALARPPRAAIADRLTLTERFLVVGGDLRTYKIHLGSANVLMEPDGAYLCVVPARRRDARIADESILRQVRVQGCVRGLGRSGLRCLARPEPGPLSVLSGPR